MVESRKITLIIEKSLVPRKAAVVFSCRSKRQGVKFPVNTGEIYIYPHAKGSGAGHTSSCARMSAQSLAEVWCEGGGGASKKTQFLRFVFLHFRVGP